MVVLEAIGLAASDIFNYNRESFKWDQELRFKKNETRLNMQIERFDLFREDIEDLVNLTVGKMDMYHGVGEIFLAFSLTLYTEGRLLDTSPTFYTSTYFFSIACAWIYILLSVWLAVYASISAHSFGVRLRTRYVRLPIPSLAHINRLTAQLSDFERQNMKDMMRVPFSSGEAQVWQYQGGPDTTASSSSTSWNAQMRGRGNTAEADLLGPGLSAFGVDGVLDAAAAHTDKHVQLYRRLQAKWQCFDAYSRVSMALGVNNLLQAVNFFVIGITLVNSKSKSTGYSLTCVFQAARLALGYLDIAGKNKRTVTLVQLVGTAPVVIVLVALSFDEAGRRSGIAATVAFLLMAFWLELLIWVARPSDDEASLPRNYRTVLFLDVFGGEAYDPTEAEHRHLTSDDVHSSARVAQERQAATAELALGTAQAALRRWEAVPRRLLPEAQLKELADLRREYTIWRKSYQGFVVQQKSSRQLPANDTLRDRHELRPWADLTREEQDEDEFAQTWLGPLTRQGGDGLYFNPELSRESREVAASERVLTLPEVSSHVGAAADLVQELLSDDARATKSERRKKEPQAKHGKVIRLPWKVLNFISRVMQLMWVFLAVMQGAEVAVGHVGGHMECFPWETCPVLPGKADEPKEETEERTEHKERRLGLGLPEWPLLSSVPVVWPHGQFFRPTGLQPTTTLQGEAALLVSTDYALYTSIALHAQPLHLKAFRRVQDALPLCSRPAHEGCMLAGLRESSVAVWKQGSEEVVLPIRGKPWHALTGTTVRCDEVPQLVDSSDAGARCILLAGWNGNQVPLTVLPLTAGGELRGREIAPRFDVPTPKEVAALHVERTTSRLWVLSALRTLQVWDLRGLRRLGEWRLRWPGSAEENMTPSAVAVCDGRLWLAGVDKERGPSLLHAALPADLQTSGEL